VDVDFPVVYRALAGLDSVAQAAGRCDREGRLTEAAGEPGGRVVVFRAPTDPPPGILRTGLQVAESLLKIHGGSVDLSDPAIFQTYFRMLYGNCDTDREGVQTERATLNFANVAQKFKLIEDGYTTPVVVPWGDAAARLAAYRREPGRETLRGLQPFVVQITPQEVRWLGELGGLESVQEDLWTLSPLGAKLYDERFGLVVDQESRADVEALIGI
jgi:CRISPR-associated endonuclease/helicase Cas3